MSNKGELHEAQRVLEQNRELVFSMIMDQDKLDAPLVRIWTALASMIEEVESSDKYSSGLLARVMRLEKPDAN